MSNFDRKKQNQKIFTNIFDYDGSSKYYDVLERENVFMRKIAMHNFIARVRLDHLFWGRIVLSDDQLIHSLFFSQLLMEEHPTTEFKIFEMLPLEVFEVRTRKETIEHSLISMIKPDHGDTLNEHLFTCLDPKGEWVKEISTRPSSSVNGLKDIVQLLFDCAANDSATEEKIAKAEVAWNFLIQSDKENKLKSIKRNTNFPFIEVENNNFRSVLEKNNLVFETSSPKKWLHDFLDGRKVSRTHLVAALNRQEFSSEIERKEWRELDAALSWARNYTQAEMNQCSICATSQTFEASEEYRDRTFLGKSLVDNFSSMLHLDDDVICDISEMHHLAYQNLYARVYSKLQNWHQTQKRKNLEDAVEIIAKELLDTSPRERETHIYAQKSHWLNVAYNAIPPIIGAVPFVGGWVGSIVGDYAKSKIKSPSEQLLDNTKVSMMDYVHNRYGS